MGNYVRFYFAKLTINFGYFLPTIWSHWTTSALTKTEKKGKTQKRFKRQSQNYDANL